MKFNLLASVIMCAVLVSCKVKVMPIENIMMQDAYTQQEIPGNEKGTIIDYLKLSFDMKDPQNTQIIEVVFRNKSYTINSNRAELRIDLSKGSVDQKKKSLKENEALVFYSVNKKNYTLTVRNIVSKPPLYLP